MGDARSGSSFGKSLSGEIKLRDGVLSTFFIFVDGLLFPTRALDDGLFPPLGFDGGLFTFFAFDVVGARVSRAPDIFSDF